MDTYKFSFKPTSLTIVTTYQCNAACENCCFTCSPKRTEKLTFSDIKEIIDIINKDFPSIKIIIFTGGEPFLLGDSLLKSINYAAESGKLVRVVSNAYWAKSYKQAYKLLNKYKENGLFEINYSTGDEHQQFVPYDNIIKATRAALDLSLPVALNIESHSSKKFKLSTIKEDIRLYKYRENPNLHINPGMWMPQTDATKCTYKKLEETNNKSKTKKEGCDTLFLNIGVSPLKELFSCCGFCSYKSKYLQFGKIKSDSISEQYYNQYDDFVKLWLFTSGPSSVAEHINKYKHEKKINYNQKHPCAVCEEILTDKENIEILRSNYKDIITDVVLKYKLIHKLYEKNASLPSFSI